MASKRNSSRQDVSVWSHTPDALTLAWLAISLPLVTWDTGYIFGRPHTMKGGFLSWPLYTPYLLYAEVDYVYGWDAYNNHDGFTAAQGFLNIIETAMYIAYIYIIRRNSSSATPWTASGRPAALAVLLGFSAAVMTFSKTALYWLQEIFGEFSHIAHNELFNLIFVFIIPNFAWFIGSGYMIWALGIDLIDGLSGTPAQAKKNE